mmetsp:Transcript_32992/g.102346  ORF Transcript_32992/g.102346 Transcript_32992/m.102346 type:complete len:374 (-) Transcript_32992:107-1228(-)
MPPPPTASGSEGGEQRRQHPKGEEAVRHAPAAEGCGALDRLLQGSLPAGQLRIGLPGQDADGRVAGEHELSAGAAHAPGDRRHVVQHGVQLRVKLRRGQRQDIGDVVQHVLEGLLEDHRKLGHVGEGHPEAVVQPPQLQFQALPRVMAHSCQVPAGIAHGVRKVIHLVQPALQRRSELRAQPLLPRSQEARGEHGAGNFDHAPQDLPARHSGHEGAVQRPLEQGQDLLAVVVQELKQLGLLLQGLVQELVGGLVDHQQGPVDGLRGQQGHRLHRLVVDLLFHPAVNVAGDVPNLAGDVLHALLHRVPDVAHARPPLVCGDGGVRQKVRQPRRSAGVVGGVIDLLSLHVGRLHERPGVLQAQVSGGGARNQAGS